MIKNRMIRKKLFCNPHKIQCRFELVLNGNGIKKYVKECKKKDLKIFDNRTDMEVDNWINVNNVSSLIS